MIIVIDHTIIIRTPGPIVMGISRTLLVYFERRGGLVFFCATGVSLTTCIILSRAGGCTETTTLVSK